MKMLILLTSVVVSLSSCIHPTVVVTNNNLVKSEVEPSTVAIYTSSKMVPSGMKRYAIISMMAPAGYNNGEFYKAAQKAAAKLGADGVLIDTVIDPTTGQRVVAAIFGTQARKEVEGWALSL